MALRPELGTKGDKISWGFLLCLSTFFLSFFLSHWRGQKRGEVGGGEAEIAASNKWQICCCIDKQWGQRQKHCMHAVSAPTKPHMCSCFCHQSCTYRPPSTRTDLEGTSSHRSSWSWKITKTSHLPRRLFPKCMEISYYISFITTMLFILIPLGSSLDLCFSIRPWLGTRDRETLIIGSLE